MSRKTIVALISGYIISMLPVWELTTRLQAVTLMAAASICVLFVLIWVEERILDIKRALTFADALAHKKTTHK
ncbi:MAG: hypothetical protein UFJ18_07105 [Blautia sp.]|nr:hypothetical protein [Blautia sp.]